MTQFAEVDAIRQFHSVGQGVGLVALVIAVEAAVEQDHLQDAIDVTLQKQLHERTTTRQRLEAIGVLAEGAAHEINTPLQTIKGGLSYLRDRQRDIQSFFHALSEILDDGDGRAMIGLAEAARNTRVLQTQEDVSDAIRDSQHAVESVAEINRAINVASSDNSAEYKDVSLRTVIEDSLTLTRNRWKGIATPQCRLATDSVRLFGSHRDLCQAFCELIMNAVEAIAATHAELSGPGVISIRSELATHGDYHLIFQDDGPGFPDQVRARAFEPFYTTKDVGEGRGQGLTVVYDIVANRHGGDVLLSNLPAGGAQVRLVFPGARIGDSTVASAQPPEGELCSTSS